MNTISKLMYLGALAMLLLNSCSKESNDDSLVQQQSSKSGVKAATITGMNFQLGAKQIDFCGTTTNTTFRDYGQIKVYNNADSLFIEITLTDSRQIKSTHVYYGDIANVPLRADGLPDYKLFPSICTFTRPCPDVVTFSLPLAQSDCNVLFIKLATVKPLDDGTFLQDSWWVDGQQYLSTQANYIEYCKKSCCTITNIEYNLYEKWGKDVLGKVSVTNNNDSVFFTYTLINGWNILNAHLSIEAIGKKIHLSNNVLSECDIKGKKIFNCKDSTQTFAVAISQLGGASCFDFVAHVVTYKTIGKHIKVDLAWTKVLNAKKHTMRDREVEYCIQSCN